LLQEYPKCPPTSVCEKTSQNLNKNSKK